MRDHAAIFSSKEMARCERIIQTSLQSGQRDSILSKIVRAFLASPETAALAAPAKSVERDSASMAAMADLATSFSGSIINTCRKYSIFRLSESAKEASQSHAVAFRWS